MLTQYIVQQNKLVQV